MIDIIVLLALGFVIGYKVSEIIHLLSFRRIMRDLKITEQQLREVARDNGIDVPDDRSEEDRELGIRETIHIKIEQHGGQIYAYKSDTDEFLGQGTDLVDQGKDLLQKSHG